MSWRTVWRGTPQDLMDHILDGHNVPGEIKRVSLEMLFPPWTVTHQLYADCLSAQHSGISNDVLLFSEVGNTIMPTAGGPSGGSSGATCCPVASTASRTDGLGATSRPPDVAGDNKDIFWIRLLGSRLDIRSRTRGWRQEPWCLIVVRHCCRCL